MQEVDGNSGPRRQEWGLINKYKAAEFERMKMIEKSVDRDKKLAFRRQLDQQLNNRNDAQQRQKQQDKLYALRQAQQAQQLRVKQQLQKYQRFIKRKGIEQQNQHTIDSSRVRLTDYDTGYHLDIGANSQKLHSVKSHQNKKLMMDTLDMQMREKDEEARSNRLKEMQMEEANKQVVQGYFKPSDRRAYMQNQKVYDYYSRIEQERMVRERETEAKLMEEAYERHIRAQDQQTKLEEMKKQMDKQRVKEALDKQVKQLSQKRVQQSKVNPEELTYGFISNVFRQKDQAYNKQTYRKQLLMQAQQQRQRKQKQNLMSEQEYRLNMNQLNKVVAGTYSQQNYLDRSLGSIGDRNHYDFGNIHNEVKDEDSQAIKARLQTIKGKVIPIPQQSRQR